MKQMVIPRSTSRARCRPGLASGTDADRSDVDIPEDLPSIYYFQRKFTSMRKKGLLLIPVVLVGVYLVGPSPATPVYSKEMPALPSDPARLDAYVRAGEAQHKIKPDNEARIVWSGSPSQTGASANGDSTHTAELPDSLKHRTDYAIVYLHG